VVLTGRIDNRRINGYGHQSVLLAFPDGVIRWTVAVNLSLN